MFWVIKECYDVCVRARIKNKVGGDFRSGSRLLNLCFITYLNINVLAKNLQKSHEKCLATFGGNVKKPYLCTRNRER